MTQVTRIGPATGGETRGAMRWRWAAAGLVAVALAAGCSNAHDRTADGVSSADNVQTAVAEGASKDRFIGQLGDFLVVADARDAEIFPCAASTPLPLSDALRAEELWSDAFGDNGIGWACPGDGVGLINNNGPTGEGFDGQTYQGVRGYIRAVPLPLLWDAPRDRLELITVEGHPALLERPVPGYPYGKANLAVIERYPDGGRPGIAVFVLMASSADSAIQHAAEIMP